MKGNVYVIRRNGWWRAVLTIEPSVDYLHWFGEGSGSGKADIGWLWREQLPLGHACWIVEQWNRREENGGAEWVEDSRVISDRIRAKSGVERPEAEKKLNELAIIIEQLQARVRGESTGGGEKRQGRKHDGNVRSKQKAMREHCIRLKGMREHKQRAVEALFQRVEIWTLRGVGSGEKHRGELESGVRGSEGAARQAGGEARIGTLAAMTKLAAKQLQGRALLGSEARALLEGAALPGAGESWSEVFQLASLLGQVRLSGAIAADWGGREDAARRCRCLRCGSGETLMRRTRCAACGGMCAYCEACLTMGRSRECELLIRGVYSSQLTMKKEIAVNEAGGNAIVLDEKLSKWGLSPAQHAAAATALQFVEKTSIYNNALNHRSKKMGSGERRGVQEQRNRLPEDVHRLVQQEVSKQVSKRMYVQLEKFYTPARLNRHSQLLRLFVDRSKELWSRACTLWTSLCNRYERQARLLDERSDIQSFLLWAVTGAGKTEMIFPLVESVLSRGGKVLIASPRRDVVIELDPRIRRAFPDATVVTLYGGSEQRWERGAITLSTTHQLFRFHEAFDLVIIDEIDAFPYHGDPMLHYAANKCCRKGAPRLLLSATPPRELQVAAKRGELAHARVPVRFHGHPLPVPKLFRTVSVKQMLGTNKLPHSLTGALQKSLNRGAQIFVFVQRIALVDRLAELIRSKLQCEAVAATSSKDPERAQKVISFRNADIRVLVTTTILERGVTIPKSDVFILDADGGLFDEASLVQMAGRAGRSAADPRGKVYFYASERNQAQLRALRHIRAMNRIAGKKGFLHHSPRKGVQGL